jgi:hypothetical protein
MHESGKAPGLSLSALRLIGCRPLSGESGGSLGAHPPSLHQLFCAPKERGFERHEPLQEAYDPMRSDKKGHAIMFTDIFTLVAL